MNDPTKKEYISFLEENNKKLPSHYRIHALLGEGAFSLVYKGVNTKTGDDVAIKVIKKKNLTKKQVANIKNEIFVMNTLKNSGSHPNILNLIESFESEDISYLILEYCDGGEIFDKIIEHTYFSEDLARHVFLQLLDAIRYMHEQNIVHRDIKPENLLFKRIPKIDRSKNDFHACLRSSDDDSKVDEGVFRPGIGGGGIGAIMLADFGLAKQLKYNPATAYGSARSNLKTPCGTAGYTAPEVIHCGVERKCRFRSAHSKSNFYSKSVDIWSLGCFLYTSLCGFPPFYDDENEILTHKILTGDFVFLEPWWDEISTDAKDLISRMLTVDVKTRITIEEIYKHSWMAQAAHLNQEDYFPVHNISQRIVDFSTGSIARKRVKSPVGMAGGLMSPKIAIKQVFDNPAMSHVNLKSLMYARRDKVYGDSKVVKFDSRARRDSTSISHLPRTPNPMNKVNFCDVFKKSLISGSFSGSDDEFESKNSLCDSDEYDCFDESGESDLDDLTRGWFVADSSINGNIKSEHNIESTSHKEGSEVRRLKHLSLSSSSSLDSQKSNNNDYVTRSSSVISGANGEFEFTLNLNDSNLLRRRSSAKGGRH